MSAHPVTRKPASKAQGKVCPRHPEDNGMRYANNRACVSCASMWRELKGKTQITRAALRVQRDELLAALAARLTDAVERDPVKWHEAKRAGRFLIAKVKGGPQ